MRFKDRRGTRRGAWAALLAFFMLVSSFTLGNVLPAGAAEGDPEYLQIDKTISSADLTAGDQFTYTIQVTCSEADCINAAITDAFPAELDGFPITNVTLTPATSVVPRDVTWGPGSPGQPTAFGPDTTLRVDLKEPLSGDAVGLSDGRTFAITISSQVPDDHAPGIVNFTNEAKTTADNAQPVSDSVDAVITVPRLINVDTTKTWSPATATWAPGAASTITLGITNTSRGAVEKLVLQEPKAAADGAGTLDASNPFVLHDFAGFGTTTLPTGCTSVQVDAYVLTGTTWGWVTGTAGANPALPAGVTNADVGGLRITCEGDAIRPNSAGSFPLNLTQRATDRNTGDSFETVTRTTDNTVSGSAHVEGVDPATDDANASHQITPTAVSANATKTISPSRIPAGDEAKATIKGTNTSSGGVSELRLSDLDFFTAQVTFGGFDSAPAWPAGATSAQFIYYPLAGGDGVVVPFASGSTPSVPAGTDISGFELVFTADDNGIEAGAEASAGFGIATDPAMAAGAEVPLTNEVIAAVKTDSGRSATDDDSAGLTIVKPSINVSLDKTIRPSTPVEPGESVITTLNARTAAESEFVNPKTILVEDVWGNGADEFWNAFNLAGVAPTQVLPNSSLKIRVQVGGSWVEVGSFGSQPNPRVVQLSGAEIAAAIAPAAIDAVTGIQFEFTADDLFPAGTTVQPHFVSQARSTLRTGGPVTPEPAPSQRSYENTATTTGTGLTPGGESLTGTDSDTGRATIERFPGGEGPGVGIDKDWNLPTVDAQSGQQRSTALLWEVDPGFATVTISDPADPEAVTSPERTVFQAFDLIGLNPIDASNEPFSNGWWLKYDQITAVQLYNGTAWVTVDAPTGGWINASGRFVGYTLTTAQRASTIGVRIVLAENTAARNAAQQVGPAFDPYAPAPGSGVGASSSVRRFDLTWQIRTKTRVGGDFVTADLVYNAADPGVVDNTVRLDATRPDNSTATDTGDDKITILEQPSGVDVGKTVTPAQLLVPPANAPTASYPTARFVLTGRNTSTAAASFVRLTDPSTCADGALSACTTPNTAAGATANPFAGITGWADFGTVANPFDRFNAEDITIAASIGDEVDLAATTVWLLTYSGGTFTPVQTTAAAVNAMTTAQLADVVGISVAFQGTNPAANGGSITSANNLTVTIDARVRGTVRSTGADQALNANQTVPVTNRVFAQSYDPVLHGDTATSIDNAQAGTTLSGGTIAVGATKSVSPTQLIEPQRRAPVRVTLGANSSTSTLSPVSVRLEDQAASPQFWNAFEFTGLGTITAPAGADRVRVDVYGPFGADDELGWVTGTAQPVASPVVPVATGDYPDIQGVRFVFTKNAGGVFSTLLPAPSWTASAQFEVKLLDEYRDGTGPIPMQGSIPNTVTAQNNGALASSDEKTADASVTLSPGTHHLKVNKLANNGTHFVTPGAAVPYRLQFQNSGTGYLTITELRDTLPAELAYLSEPATTYTAQPDGLLSEDVSLRQEGQDLIFTWPEDGRRMAPGEQFEITLYLELQPTGAGNQIRNLMVVGTEQELQSCGNINPIGSTTPHWSTNKQTCGTTDYVEPAPGPNLFTVKGVKGELDGAVNPRNPDVSCRTLAVDGTVYFRSPCAANSVIGGTDDWVLHVANAGTTGVTSMTLFDQLPTAGDLLLVSGTTRGSVYRPQLVADSIAVTAPAGTTRTVEVTQSPGACKGTWPTVQTQTPCEQNGESWVLATDPGVDWSLVTGVRVTLNFTGTPAGSLQPAQAVDVTFSTTNVPESTANPGGAPVEVPATDSFAWNQFGVKYQAASESNFRKIAPSAVGVHLLTGPIQVTKQVTGPGAKYAADAFRVDVVCEAAGAPLDLGDQATVTLSEANGYTHRIDGIPVPASCTLTEQGEVGEFGETSRSGTPVDLAVEIPASADDEVPEAQAATITNDYQLTGLSVTKRVSTSATEAEFGPFSFTLGCTSITGRPVTFDDEGSTELEFAIGPGETFTAPANRIPVGATCTLSESDSASADGTVFVGDNVTDNGDGSATVVPGEEPAEVEVTNAFNAGVLELAKLVDGDGVELYGSGPFVFQVDCTWKGQTLMDSSFELAANATRTVGPFPVGTACAVSEVGTGGATSSTLSPSGTVVIPALGEEENLSLVTVTATNTFDLTSLEVTKRVEGSPAVDEFTVSLGCTWDVNGTEQSIEIPGGAERVISGGETVTYADLPVGAACELSEIDDGDADSTVIKVTSGGQSETTKGTDATIEAWGHGTAKALITNTFDDDELGFTGANPGVAALLGTVLLAGGAGLVVAVRRRRSGAVGDGS